MTTKEEVHKHLNETLYGHPSRDVDLKVIRLERIVLILADKIDKVYQEGFEHGYDNGKKDSLIK